MKKYLLTILILTSLVLTGCLSKPQTNQNTNAAPEKPEVENENVDTPTATKEIDISDWKTYWNEEYGFEIKYPHDWEFRELREGTKVGEENIRKPAGWVIFDVVGSQEGRWGIQFYRKSDELEQDVSQTGNQFNDRKERRENIEFNDINALYVIVTTEQYKWWISESIYFLRDDILFKIDNGAVKDDEFNYFYKSFRFIN